MKKVLLMMLSVLAIAFTSCKVEDANVTAYVEDKDGAPVEKCYVFYIDKASYILDAVLPSPETLLTGDNYSDWSYVVTNKLGFADIKVPLAVSKAKFYFFAYDEINKKWYDKEVTLRKGENEPIEFYFK